MARKKSKGANIVVWVILALLIVGLAGFGATNFGGNINSIGQVGDRDIGVQRYARELQNQIRAFSAQFGNNMTFSQAQAFGIDRMVLQQLVSTVALENEATNIGLSAGDDEVKTAILATGAFQGLDGTFDRESYRFVLEREGLNEKQFENDLRAEIARTLVQGSVAGGVTAPDAFTDTLFAYIGERRSFGFATLGVDALTSDIPAPTDADLRSYFDANEADFMLPETRAITYVWMTPDMLVDSIDLDEEALKQLYQDRIDEFVKPERRLVERLILGDDAADAKARLDAGELTFEELVAERELTLQDIDLGDVTAEALGAAGDVVFAGTEPGVYGPAETELGAALFRVNAVLAAQETPYEEARAELVDAFALDRAARVIGDQVEDIDDLLAGGATLEELAAETEMELGQIDWTATASDGVAGYAAFRQAAATAAEGDFPEVAQLDDGGIFALRINSVTKPQLQDFADARAQAESGWRAEATVKALTAQAKVLADQLTAGQDADTLGLTLQQEADLTRERFVPDTPADFMETVFDMAPGDVRVVTGETAAYLLRLDSVQGPEESAENATRRDALIEATAQGIGADILQAYSRAIEAGAGIALNQHAINAVHTQLP